MSRPGYAMTDPNKLTLLTPGFDRATGAYAEHGVPAPIVAEYLRENRIVCEKNDLNSILFLLTPGVESSKAGTLLSALVRFKELHDDERAARGRAAGVRPPSAAQRYGGHAAARPVRARCTASTATTTPVRCSAGSSGRSICPRW